MAKDNGRKKGDGTPKRPKREGETPPREEGAGNGGFLSNLFRPLRKHRVTLTRVGKARAPLRKGKAAPAKASTTKKPATKAGRAVSASPSLKERQVRELKTLARIGKQNPERLAGIISKMLLAADEEERAARARLEQMIWDKAEKKVRREQRRAQEGDEGTQEG